MFIEKSAVWSFLVCAGFNLSRSDRLASYWRHSDCDGYDFVLPHLAGFADRVPDTAEIFGNFMPGDLCPWSPQVGYDLDEIGDDVSASFDRWGAQVQEYQRKADDLRDACLVELRKNIANGFTPKVRRFHAARQAMATLTQTAGRWPG